MQCVVDTRDQLGECVLWCPRSQRLWWVDVLSASLHELSWPAGQHRTHQLPFRRLGSIGLRASGGLVLATEQGVFGWHPDRGVGAQLMAPRWDPATHRLNDGRCDRAGRFWVGSMHDSLFVPDGTLFSIGPAAEAVAHFDDIIVPNSLAFSPDDRRFYFADTRRYMIWQFDFDIESGRIGNRRPFVDFGSGPARPDGSCVDANGCLWNAVLRWRTRGAIYAGRNHRHGRSTAGQLSDLRMPRRPRSRYAVRHDGEFFAFGRAASARAACGRAICASCPDAGIGGAGVCFMKIIWLRDRLRPIVKRNFAGS